MVGGRGWVVMVETSQPRMAHSWNIHGMAGGREEEEEEEEEEARRRRKRSEDI